MEVERGCDEERGRGGDEVCVVDVDGGVDGWNGGGLCC